MDARRAPRDPAVRRAHRRAARRPRRGRRPRPPFAPGDELFHEGAPADVWWVLLEGSIACCTGCGPRGEPARRDVDAGPVGGRLPGLGRPRHLHASGRGADHGRVLRVPAERLRALRRSGSPSGCTSSRGSPTPYAGSRHRSPARGAGRARHPGRRTGARDQQPGLGGDAGRRRPAGHQRGPAGLARRPRRAHRSPPASSSPSTTPRRARRLPADARSRRGRRARGGARRLARRTTTSSATGCSPRRSRPPAPTWRGASGWRPCSEGPALEPGLSGSPAPCRMSDAARRGQGGHRPHLGARRRRAVLLPARPRVRAADRRHRGPREHPGHARPQARATASPWSATTPRTCRASR